VLVLSNHRLGPGVELVLSEDVLASILRATAEAARPVATARWELELVAWLERRAQIAHGLDVSEVAWTPEHFEHQREFLADAIARAADGSPHAATLERWRRLVAAHPRDSVQVGRRWPTSLNA